MKELAPTAVVLPDAPGDFVETRKRGVEFLRELRGHKWANGVETMSVLHAPDGELGVFEMAYKEAAQLSEWVGFSRLTKFYSEQTETASRAGFLAQLKMINYYRPDRHHHALGMRNGSLVELADLTIAGFESCDSSAPIWRGLHGFHLEDSTWPDFPFTPHAHKVVHTYQVVESNIRKTKEACRWLS